MTTLETISLAAGDLNIELLPTRGLDIGAARFRGERFSWESALGHRDGLMFTCGLQNVGVPSEGQPQHGHYPSLPACEIETEDMRARARVVEANLELLREVALDAHAIRITDVTRNTGKFAEPAPLLYHVNVLWGPLETDASEVHPRDADAAALDWRVQGTGPERVYEHVGASHAAATAVGTRVTVTSSLSRLWQWVDPAYGVLGIEPANCSVLGRAHDRAEGRLPMLAPGEERTTTLEIMVEAA